MRFIIKYLILICFSCQSNLSEPDLNSYLRDKGNNLFQEKQTGIYDISMQYKSPDLIAFQDYKGKGAKDKNYFLQQKNKYSKYLYFNLNISGNEEEVIQPGAGENFNELLQTMAFHLHEHIYIRTSDNKEIPLLDHHFPRTFGMMKKTSLLLVFERKEIENAKWMDVVVQDFGLGFSESFRFNMDDIKQVPELQLN